MSWKKATVDLLQGLARAIRPPRIRSYREFAEQEIVVPTGPLPGRKLKVERNPFVGLILQAFDSDVRRRFVTGPQQSGKSLIGFVLPILYHLFEVRETVLVGLPSLDLVADKWRLDILPVIRASRYADLLPASGAGSKDGESILIQFRHGPVLRFMTGGGGDKARSAFTSRVLVMSEIDGMDTAGGSSREADKISQLEGRTSAYGDRARIYGECTPSTEAGRIWTEYTHGTSSRIACRCPHCLHFVTPEREHLVGWRDAANVLEAKEKAAIVCPLCGATWSEADRMTANAAAVLAHAGQTVTDEGQVMGPMPPTDTLGLRWTAANNMLKSIGVVAQEEWKAARAADEENADKKMRQWHWALPAKPAAVDETELDYQAICRRISRDPQGQIPGDTVAMGLGIDTGKHLCHWVLLAERADGSPHVVDYGRLEVPSGEMEEARALRIACLDFVEVIRRGWDLGKGRIGRPGCVLQDSGWKTDAVYDVAREMHRLLEELGVEWYPTKGFGEGQYGRRGYTTPKEKGRLIAHVGDNFHVVRMLAKKVRLYDVSADAWKTWVHEALAAEVGTPGSMTLYQAEPQDHLTLAKHFTAEKRQEHWEPGVGRVMRWFVAHRNNHFLDACALAGVALQYQKEKREKGRSLTADRTEKAKTKTASGWKPWTRAEASEA